MAAFLVLALVAGGAQAVEFQLQRAGSEAAMSRWSTYSSIPGSFLSMPPGGAGATRFSDLGECLGLYMCKRGDDHHYPKAGDKLTMHYTGKLTKDDSQFDSSRDRGQPFTFTIGVGQVIKGWEAGIMKMSLGERAVLQVPAAMGYGARGAGGKIPPNADLYFDVELLAINGREEPKKGGEKLPEQGYSGKKVAHKNMETCTDDWRREYGPKAGKDGSCSEKKEKKEVAPKPKKEKSGSVHQFAFSWATVAVALFAALY